MESYNQYLIRMLKVKGIKEWRTELSVEAVNGKYCYVNTSENELLANLDWLILQLDKAQASREKILESLNCL